MEHLQNRALADNALHEFATQGWRTLCYSQRKISRTAFEEWQRSFHEAENEEHEMELLAESGITTVEQDDDVGITPRPAEKQESADKDANKIVKNVEDVLSAAKMRKATLIRELEEGDPSGGNNPSWEYLGATGVEDVLQDNVSAALTAFREAGIFLWLLTGDKLETAVSIGLSSGLITSDMVQFTLASGGDHDENQLRRTVKECNAQLEEYLKAKEQFSLNDSQEKTGTSSTQGKSRKSEGTETQNSKPPPGMVFVVEGSILERIFSWSIDRHLVVGKDGELVPENTGCGDGDDKFSDCAGDSDSEDGSDDGLDLTGANDTGTDSSDEDDAENNDSKNPQRAQFDNDILNDGEHFATKRYIDGNIDNINETEDIDNNSDIEEPEEALLLVPGNNNIEGNHEAAAPYDPPVPRPRSKGSNLSKNSNNSSDASEKKPIGSFDQRNNIPQEDAGQKSKRRKKKKETGAKRRDPASTKRTSQVLNLTPSELQASLKYFDMFLRLLHAADVVICCRVTPLQKALMVKLARNHCSELENTFREKLQISSETSSFFKRSCHLLRAASPFGKYPGLEILHNGQCGVLAVGDGANDAMMIKEADVGVGIRGKEGGLACQVADFSLQEFQHLQRLVLLHGPQMQRISASFIFWVTYYGILSTTAPILFVICCNRGSVTPFMDDDISTYICNSILGWVGFSFLVDRICRDINDMVHIPAIFRRNILFQPIESDQVRNSSQSATKGDNGNNSTSIESSSGDQNLFAWKAPQVPYLSAYVITNRCYHALFQGLLIFVGSNQRFPLPGVQIGVQILTFFR